MINLSRLTHLLARRPAAPRSSVTVLTLAVAVFVAAVDNGAFWRAVHDTTQVGLTNNPGFGIAIVLAMLSFFMLVLSLFGIKYLLKPALAGFLLLASTVSYFMHVYGIVVDDVMVQNVLETSPKEAGDLLSHQLLVHVLLTGILPALVVFYWRVRWHSLFRETALRLATFAVAFLVFAGMAYWHYKDFALVVRSHPELRYLVNPTYPLYAVADEFSQDAHADEPVRPLGTDARLTATPGAPPRIVIMVVGETARAANFSLGGYARRTNPKLADDNVIYFDDFHSCGTSTAVSVPCMFSRLNRAHYDDFKAEHTQNLLDVLQHAGVDVLWRDNNTGCKDVCARVPTQDMADMTVPDLCGGERCYDAILLKGLKDRIAAATGDLFIVLHQEGSHGPAYYKRYPERFEHFKPVCNSNMPQECSRQAIVNAYDNTIAYTDDILDRIIAILRADALASGARTALFYVSDHGESLGEDGLYLHGFPVALAPDVQTHVPAIAWFSDTFRQADDLQRRCLDRLRSKAWSHDNVFDTMLGLFGVQTRVYKPAGDIFSGCRRAHRMDAIQPSEAGSTSAKSS